MKYKHRRNVVNFHRFRKNLPKKMVKLILVLTAIWLTFFQGAPWPAIDSGISAAPQEPKEVPEVVSSSWPIIHFIVFICVLCLVFQFLNWWHYDRSNYLGDVRMLTDEERKRLIDL